MNTVLSSNRQEVTNIDRVFAQWINGYTVDVSKTNFNWLLQTNLAPATDVGYWVRDVAFTAKSGGLTPYNFAKGKINKIERSIIGRFNCYYNTEVAEFIDCIIYNHTYTSSIIYSNSWDNVTFTRCTFQMTDIQNTVLNPVHAMYLTGCSNNTLNDCVLIATRLYLTNSNDININNTKYVSGVYSTSPNNTSNFHRNQAITIGGGNRNIFINGLTLPIPANSPNGAIIGIKNTKSTELYISNIGTIDNPLDCSSPYPTDYFFYLYGEQKSSGLHIRDCYAVNCGTLGDDWHGDYNAEITNSGAGYGSSSGMLIGASNSIIRGVQSKYLQSNNILADSSDGVLIADYFDSTTTGWLGFWSSPQDKSLDKITLIGGAYRPYGRYNVSCPNAGDGIELEMGYFRLGHTGFQNIPVSMENSYFGNAANFNYQYSIDINDGNGYSVMSNALSYTALPLALSAITIDAIKGFKLKLRVLYIGNTNSHEIRRFAIFTTSTLAGQRVKYPTFEAHLTLNGFIDGSDIVILKAGSINQIQDIQNIVGTSYMYTYNTTQLIDIGIFKQGYKPLYIRNYQLGITDASLPIAQVVDRNFK